MACTPGTSTCVSNAAYIDAATKQAAAIKNEAIRDVAIQTSVALWQRNSSQSISNMQTDLAEQQVELAEQVHAHAILFWPEEAELVNDVFGEGKLPPPYAALSSAWSGLAAESMQAGRQVWIDAMRAACLSPSRCEDTRWQRNATAGQVDLASYGDRQAEAREQITNDRRYARQLAVLGLGRGRLDALVSYQGISQFSGLNASGMLEAGINSALTTYGYYSHQRTEPAGWGTGIRQTWEARMPMPVVTKVTTPPVPTLPPVERGGKEGESDWSGINAQ